MYEVIVLKVFVLLMLSYNIRNDAPKTVMQKFSSTIGDYVLEYQQLTGFKQNIIPMFLGYWAPDTSLDDVNFGCVVMWLLRRLELVNTEGQLREDNAKAFLAAKGSDTLTRNTLIQLYELCTKSIDVSLNADECHFGLELAKCLRAGVMIMHWVPDSIVSEEEETFDERHSLSFITVTLVMDLPFEELMMEWKHVLVLVMLSAAVKNSEAADAMRLLASGFMKVLEECQKELNLNESLFSELYHYWKLDFALMQRDTGCAIICMSKKLDLMSEDGKMHHGNAKEFAIKNGAGDEVATKMVSIIHACETKSEGIEDDCLRILEVAKCFRLGIHEIHWEPKVDVIVTEVLTDI